MRGELVAAATLLAAATLAAPAAAHDVDVDVLSSRADQVSGGDALIRVEGPRKRLDDLSVRLNRRNVTDAFEERHGKLVGLVEGMRLGRNEIAVYDRWRRVARLKLRNHPVEGPIFSGPHQRPFVCKTNQTSVGLGEPLVDNQDGDGFRVLAPDGSTAGWSRDCSVHTQVDYLYRSTAGGALRPLPAGDPPADLATTTTIDGRTVPFIVRRERGTINRFIYSLAMLADPAAGETDTERWNRRLVYFFDGGVAIGRNQGTPGGSALNPDLLGRGYAIAHSSGTRASVHYNMVLGGETALMTKERFVERYGVPLYTVGIGGSGGAIQQYLYGQNHPGLLDGAIPTHSYPDMVTQTIHVGDCELLERYMDVTDSANPKWRVWDQREWLIGLNASDTFRNPYTAMPGATECVIGWRGLTPLAMNPLFGTAGAGTERMDPAEMAAVHWTHWEDVKNVYGVGSDGYARQTWDNVGVQYGLEALTDGKITAAEFLHLNATVGSWKDPGEMVQEGRPFLPVGTFDPWSVRNQRLTPDPAPRRTGSIAAMNAAYEEGLYFDGDIDIPIIDWRPYLEEVLDMHNSHQSFASRQRMLDRDHRASNQVIWFSAPGDDRTLEAFQVMDEWLLDRRPAEATDRCFSAAGEEIGRGSRAWAGILDSRSDGPCTEAFPLHSTSRIVAGGPLRGGVYKCAVQPVGKAIARGLYGSWRPSAAERDRLEAIFPTGVCDYRKPDVGRPSRGR
ncbi:MAG TPA: DUF6351 family protein [Solirubrobacteraceae bacterium]|nr:DUF6351 family protein [Solirubrobacteraceae bacterium]